MAILNIYNKIDDSEFEFGQDARTKEWYCKLFRAKTIREAEKKMGESNRICNKYNKKGASPAPPSLKKPNIKGLE